MKVSGKLFGFFQKQTDSFFVVFTFEKSKAGVRVLGIDRKGSAADGSSLLAKHQQGDKGKRGTQDVRPCQKLPFFFRLLYRILAGGKAAGQCEKFPDIWFFPGKSDNDAAHLIRPPKVSGFT